METRRDTLGLRAILLILFLGTALRLPLFSPVLIAGDLLFVLAGYLVTKTLIAEYRKNASHNRGRGWVELQRFYAQTAVKLVPAVLIVVGTTLFFAQVIYSGELAETIKSRALASATFFANILFIRQGVDATNLNHPQSPFLHFWITSIGAQVLVILPLIIVAALSYKGAEIRSTKLRHRRRTQFTMFGLFLISFSYMALEAIARPQATYFSTGSRVWEFALGGLFATQRIHSLSFGKQLPLVRWLALVVVLTSPFTVTANNANFAAVFPVISFGFLLASNSQRNPDLLSRVFESTVLVGLGRIAYTTMLWSWPIIVLARYKGYTKTLVEELLLTGAALLAGAITYYVIEAPLRASFLRSEHPEKDEDTEDTEDADENADSAREVESETSKSARSKSSDNKYKSPQRDRAVAAAISGLVALLLSSAPTLQAPSFLEFGDSPRPQPTSSIAPANEPVAVFLGASITSGCCTKNSPNWVDQVSTSLGWTSLNLAKFGTGFTKSNSEGVCANNNCPSIHDMAIRAIQKNPDVVVVVASRNECPTVMNNPSKVQNAIDDTFSILRNGLPKTQIIAMPAFSNDVAANPPCNQRLRNWLESAANRQNGEFVPDVGTWLLGHRNWLNNDRLHPNDAGHTQIAKRFVIWFRKSGMIVTHQS